MLDPAILAKINEDYDVTCYSGQTRKQSELSAAFDRVAPKPNWKMPIDCLLPGATDSVLIVDAVVHFTGSVAKFCAGPGGWADSMRVTADGYYRTIGA